jgi:hypothetical protein
MYFIMDMLVLAQPQNCPFLLSGEDDRLLLNFKEFLVKCLRGVTAGLQGQLTRMLAVLGTAGKSPLRDALLDVYSEVVIVLCEVYVCLISKTRKSDFIPEKNGRALQAAETN